MDKPVDWHGVDEGLAAALAVRGLDLTHPFSMGSIETLFPHPAPNAHAILVGNTKALWSALEAAPLDDHDPIDRYVEGAVVECLAELNAPAHVVYWPDRRYDDRYLPFQRIAHAAGMAHLSPSFLLIHRDHGPWFALRAMIVFAPTEPSAPAHQPPPASDPCSPCSQPCMAALGVAQGSDAWRAWLAVRDACPEGVTSRYSDVQIRYHYTKDRALLQT